MFPYVLERLDSYLTDNLDRQAVRAACEQIAKDAGYPGLIDWQEANPTLTTTQLVATEVRRLMASDVKATGMKALQGLIWDGGFRSKQMLAHTFPDVIPAIRRWKKDGIDVRIYSSGSIAAQKLFFGHLEGFGDCLELFSGHYDTTIGGKKEAASYARIAMDWGMMPAEILFISDIAGELEAAKSAGLQTMASMRPGNVELPTELDCHRITSFDQVLAATPT